MAEIRQLRTEHEFGSHARVRIIQDVLRWDSWDSVSCAADHLNIQVVYNYVIILSFLQGVVLSTCLCQKAQLAFCLILYYVHRFAGEGGRFSSQRRVS